MNDNPPSAARPLKETAASFTPREIVSELDRYIVGQHDAKRAVAIALRNRWRRQQLSEELREEVLPKNILMIGPTGVGKTEIARRLAKMIQAPFVKVEASMLERGRPAPVAHEAADAPARVGQRGAEPSTDETGGARDGDLHCTTSAGTAQTN